MTLVLTTKIKLFIQRMTESEEQAQWGFELLLKREDFEEYFDHLNEAGLFSHEHNSGPIQADQPGTVYIPFWYALNYLEAVAKLSGERDDFGLAEKLMTIIRIISSAQTQDGIVRDNHHTWRVFANIIGLVPSAVVTPKDLELIPVWLGGKYNHGMVGRSLDKGVMQKCLASDVTNDWYKACTILHHCTAINWIDKEEFGDKRQKAITVVDDFWLKKLIEHHAGNLGAKVGPETANIFLNRLREVFNQYDSDFSSWLRRPAIEDHQQNHSWEGPENRFVEGLRRVLLGWVDHDLAKAQPFIVNLVNDPAEIARRVGIHILNERWDALQSIYLDILGPQLFDSGHLHELYGLLRDHFHEFTIKQRELTVEAIRQIPRPARGDDLDRRLKYIQHNWLSVIEGKGYEPADTWFQELDSDDEFGPTQSHPDFHSYIESWSGPGPSPYSISELLAFLGESTIVERLNNFQQTNSWHGPTTRALVDMLEETVVHNHQQFLGVLPDFLYARRSYQYGIINGFKRLRDTPNDQQHQIDWDSIWEAIISFFESLLGDAGFWSEQIVPDPDFTPDRDWIPPVIADMLRSGTRNDENAYSEVLLPRTWLLIETLLENLEPEVEDEDDAMSQAINSSKGKAIEALFSHALRECRLSDRTSGGHTEVWNRMRSAFERELNKCKGANFEFSTLLGNYMANLHYIDPNWLHDNIENIFPQQFIDNFSCALEGLAYAPATRPINNMLRDGGVLDFALRSDLKGRHLREKLIERIAIAYLWGDEELESHRFAYLFEANKENDLEKASELFWSISNQEITEEQVKRISSFWKECIKWSNSLTDPPGSLLSSLSKLSCYIQSVGDSEAELLHSVTPYVYINYNADRFIEELDRLAETNPVVVSAVFGEVLDFYKPDYDYQDRILSLLTKIYDSGLRNDAMVYADRLRHIPGIQELF